MTIHLEKPSTTREWTAISLNTLSVFMKALSQDYLGAAEKLLDLQKQVVGKQDQRLGAIAWVWVQEIMLNASIAIAKEARLRTSLSSGEIEKSAGRFLQAILDEPASGTLSFIDLLYPYESAALADWVDRVDTFLADLTTESGLTPEQLEALKRRVLADSSAKVFQQSPDFYRPLEAALISTLAEASRRENAWQRHGSYIQGLFHREPIFSLNEDEEMPLSHIYIAPRGYWTDEVKLPEPTTENDGSAKFESKIYIRDLTSLLKDWSRNPKIPRDERIKVIMGGPGSGKSSFARAFASDLVSLNQHRIIYINLQHLELRADLQTSIETHLEDMHSWRHLTSDRGLPESPFTWAKVDQTPLIFIFDGLDELTARDEEAQTIAQAFLGDLNNLISKYDGSIDIRSLVLGRNAACQEAASILRLKKINLINVARFDPMSDQNLDYFSIRHRADTNMIDGEAELIDKDQRLEFWHKWVSRKGGDPKPPLAFENDDLRELTSEPLFLLLLILTDYMGEAATEVAKNKNRVYEDILKRIHQRNVMKEHQATLGVDEHDFLSLMETVGLATWHGNGRTGTDEDYRRLRGIYLGAEEDSRLDLLPGAGLKSVALQIHARKGEERLSGFEFIHKSFGEYLAARAVLNFLIGLSRDRWRSLPEKALDWARVTAFASTEESMARFLADQIRTISVSELEAIKPNGWRLLSWVVENGVPVQRLDDASGQSFRVHEDRQLNSERLLNFIVSNVTFQIVHISSSEREDDLSFTPLRKLGSPAVHRFLKRCVDTNLVERFGGNVGCSFHRVDLHGLELEHSCLPGINLSEANLSKVVMSGSMLNFATFRGAVLDDAQFVYSEFYVADFTNASLRGGHFSNCNFDGADFSIANLSGASFRGSVLTDVNFDGATLHETGLHDCDLRQAAKLTQEQIMSALGSRATQLPRGLRRPDHWRSEENNGGPRRASRHLAGILRS